MKIDRIQTYVLEHKLSEPFGFAQGWFHQRRTFLIRISTTDGIEGWGEAYGPPEVNQAITHNLLSKLILGRDPFDREVIYHEMYRDTRAFGQKGVIISVMGAVDMALWDIIGKAVELPVCKLLGGSFRREVPIYATGLYFRPDPLDDHKVIDEAVGYITAGFNSMKVKIGRSVDRDIRLVQEIRREVGSDINLMVDANCGYDAATAIQVARRLDNVNLSWFEEPVQTHDIEGYKRIRDAALVPIAAGEGEFHINGFIPLLENRAVDIVQPSIFISGGITVCRNVALFANACGMRCIPHCWGSAITVAATLQLLASLPPFPMSIEPIQPLLELDQTDNPFRSLISKDPLVADNGFMKIPEGPGLGIEIDITIVERFLVHHETSV